MGTLAMPLPLPVVQAPRAGDYVWPFPIGAALPPWLAAQLAGATWLGKRATALVGDGYELVQNGEFSLDTAGWFGIAATLARVDSAVDPGIPSGGMDDWTLRATLDGASSYAQVGVSSIVGATYQTSCLAHSPSANTGANVAGVWLGSLYWSPASNTRTTIEDTWQPITKLAKAIVTPAFLWLGRGYASAGDVAYFDSVSCQCTIAPFVVQTGWADGSIYVQIPFTAGVTTPKSLWFRSSDALNGWEIRILPNTAGTDLFLYNRQAGVYSAALISADIDWTTGAVDELCVDFRGQTISLYVRKSGETVWTLAGSYASAAFNLTATRHGFLAYGTASDQWNLIQLSTARQAA